MKKMNINPLKVTTKRRNECIYATVGRLFFHLRNFYALSMQQQTVILLLLLNNLPFTLPMFLATFNPTQSF